VEDNTEVEDKGDEDDEDEENPNAQLQSDMELGTTIRDDLVPLALEYYLGVIEQESDDDDENFDDDDSDDDAKPKK